MDASTSTRPAPSIADPFLTSSTLAVSNPHSPSSFAQSRQNKGRPVSMFLASPFNPLPSVPPKRSSVNYTTTPAPSGSNASHRIAGAAPPTPATTPLAHSGPTNDSHYMASTSPTVLISSNPSIDVEMMDAYATPPMSRILPAVNSLHLTQSSLLKVAGSDSVDTSELQQKLAVISSSKNGSSLSPIQTSHLQCPPAPLTPPLTPPYSSLSLPPTLEIIPPAPSVVTEFPTLSARLLHNYALHPLFASSYRIREELGSGGFGFVVRADRISDNLSVAVKFIERSKIPTHGWVHSRSWGEAPGLADRVEGLRVVPMEAYVLRSVRHEGVVAYVDLFEDAKYFYLVMEHHGSPWQSPDKEATSTTAPGMITDSVQTMTPVSSPTLFSASLPSLELSPPKAAPMLRRTSCDLFECIEQHSRFSEETSKFVFAQIVEVVWALGKIGICHRDIKDENIVVSSDFRVKLIDFGSAVIFDPRLPLPLYNRFHGTTSFASAEILRGEPYNAPCSEVWSLGVLLSILVTGECPFTDATAAAAGRMSQPKIRLGPEVEHLMRACLDLNVKRRITVSQIRRHPWLAGAMRRETR